MGVLSFDHALTADGETKDWNVPLSGQYMFYAVGTFGGGSLELEASPDGSNWFTVEQVSTPARIIRYLVSGEVVRMKLSGASSPSITTGIRQ